MNKKEIIYNKIYEKLKMSSRFNRLKESKKKSSQNY